MKFEEGVSNAKETYSMVRLLRSGTSDEEVRHNIRFLALLFFDFVPSKVFLGFGEDDVLF